MSIDSRIKNLERRAGVMPGDVCGCDSFSRDIRTYMDAVDNQAAADADERPAEVCGRCNRPKDIIKIILVLPGQKQPPAAGGYAIKPRLSP